MGTKQINEDEFLDLIRSRPGKSSVPTPTVTPKQSHKRKTTSPHTPTTPTSRNAPINQTTPTSSKQIKPTVTTPTRIPSPKGLCKLCYICKCIYFSLHYSDYMQLMFILQLHVICFVNLVVYVYKKSKCMFIVAFLCIFIFQENNFIA